MDKKTLVKALVGEFASAARAYDQAEAGSAIEDEALAVQCSVNRLALKLGVADAVDRALRQELDYGHGPVLSFEPEVIDWT